MSSRGVEPGSCAPERISVPTVLCVRAIRTWVLLSLTCNTIFIKVYLRIRQYTSVYVSIPCKKGRKILKKRRRKGGLEPAAFGRKIITVPTPLQRIVLTVEAATQFKQLRVSFALTWVNGYNFLLLNNAVKKRKTQRVKQKYILQSPRLKMT